MLVVRGCHLELKRKISRLVQTSPKLLTARFFAPLRMTLWVTKMIPVRIVSTLLLLLYSFVARVTKMIPTLM